MKRPGAGRNDVLSLDFADFIESLNRNGVEYVLVGGYALAVHGVIRATGDIDFFYRITDANVGSLCIALLDFGAPPNIIDRDALLTPDSVTQFGQPPHRIDLLNTIDGVSFEKAWSGAVEASINGLTVRVISKNDLRTNKLATGREKDKQDARELDLRRVRTASLRKKL